MASNSIIGNSTERFIRQLSNENTAKTFAFNSEEAEKARVFSKEMSDTSHQREVEDLKRAGLNPVLSANGGASAYSASSASATADNSAVGLIANIYQQKMNNDNAVRIAKLNNQNNLQIAKINASASKYASDNAYSASRYASDNSTYASTYGTDRSKTGAVYNLVDGLLGNGSNKNSAAKLGNKVNSVVKNIAGTIKKIFKK